MAADDILPELEQAQHEHTLLCVDVGIYTGFKKAVDIVEQLHDEAEDDHARTLLLEDILRRLYAAKPRRPL